MARGLAERAEAAGPGFVNLWLAGRLARRRRRRDRGGGRRVRVGLAPRRRERVQVEMVSANPTGPVTVAARTERRVRRLRRAAARVRRARGRARVLLQRRRRADGAVPRLGRRRAPGRGAARGRLPGRLRRRARGSSTAIPVAEMLRADRGDARALPHPLRHLGAPERRRAGDPEAVAAPRHVRGGRRRLGAHERARRRQGPRPHPLGRRADVLRAADAAYMRRKYAAGFDRLDLRPRRRPPRLRRAAAGARGDARPHPRARSRCSSTSSSTSSRAARRGRCRSGAATSSSSTSSSTTIGVDAARWYLVSRGHDQTIDLDVDLAAGAVAEEPRLLRAVRARADRGDPAQRGRRQRGGRRRVASARDARAPRSASS